MRRFYRTLQRLIDKLNFPYPIYIYFTTSKRLPDCFGDMSFTGKSFSIRIVKTNWDTALFTLLHEMAHVLNWENTKDKDSKHWHDESFGLAYSKVWRVYCGEYEG